MAGSEKQSRTAEADWIASSLTLRAMTSMIRAQSLHRAYATVSDSIFKIAEQT
jgi:hypothetical protein